MKHVLPREFESDPEISLNLISQPRRSLRQMHTNLGHPSNHALARAIRVTGGSAAAVRAALQLRCDVCESQQHPGPHLPARLRTDREFGDTAATDLFVLADCEGNQLSFIYILDLASTFWCCCHYSQQASEDRVGPLLQTLDHSFWRAAKVDSRSRRRIRA